MNIIDDPLKFREMMYGFQMSRILLTAYELDIFSQIPESGITSEALAGKICCNARATDRLMNVLCTTALLSKNNHVFYNSSFAAKYLVKSSPDYLSGFMHTVNMWDTWSTMSQVVRSGTSGRSQNKKEPDQNWAEAFIGAMHHRALTQADAVVSLFPTEKFKKILDIGGGSGAYSMAFVRRNSALQATVFDLPWIIPITEKYVKAAQMINNFSFIKGDYNHDALGEAYDLVFLSAIIHINSPEQNMLLFKKCFHSLSKDGMIAIQDHVMEDNRTKPDAGALFAMNMLVATESGDTYTENEIKGWLSEAGFSDFRRYETFNNAMITAKK